MIVHPHKQLTVARSENSIPSGYQRMWMQTWRADSKFIAFTFRWLTFSFWAFTGLKFLFLSIKKPSLLIWSESALEARKFCKGQPEEDTSIIYLPLGEGMNQINYFPWATAGRLTPAIIITIKYGGGRESISQSLTLVILASETIREQQIYSSAALSDCFPSCSSLPGSNICPLCDTHCSAGGKHRAAQTTWTSAVFLPWWNSPEWFPPCRGKVGWKWKQFTYRRAESGTAEPRKHNRNPAWERCSLYLHLQKILSI